MRNALLILTCLHLAAPALHAMDEMEASDTVDTVIERYGMDRMDDLSALKFTFTVKRGTSTIARVWTWDRAANTVTVQTADGGQAFAHTYHPGRLDEGDRAANEKADRWFVNDSFWLLFPHHLATDANLEFSGEEDAALPIGNGRAERINIQYPAQGGYTPGDGYDIFVGNDGLIRQWVYRRGGSAQPTLATTWEEHAQLGPVVVSLRRRDAAGKLDIRFTDVQAKRRGSEEWLIPTPL